MNIYYKYNKKDINKLYRKLHVSKTDFYTHIFYFPRIHTFIKTYTQIITNKDMQALDVDDFIDFIKHHG